MRPPASFVREDRLCLPQEIKNALFPSPAPFAMIDILDRRVQELERDVLVRDDAIAALQARVDRDEQMRVAVQYYLDADLHAWQQRFLLLQQRAHAMHELELRERALQSALADLDARAAALQVDCSALEINSDALAERAVELDARRAELDAREADLDARAADLKARESCERRATREVDALRAQLADSEAKVRALSASHDTLLGDVRRERAQRQANRREAAALREQFVERASYIQEIETRLERFERASTLPDAVDMRAAIEALTTTAIRMLPRFTEERTVRLMRPVVSRMRDAMAVSSMAHQLSGLSQRRGPKDAFLLYQASRKQLVDAFALTVGRALRRISEPVPPACSTAQDQTARTRASVAYVHRNAIQIVAAVYYLYAMTHMREDATRTVFRSMCADAIAIGLSMTRNLEQLANETKELQTLLRLARVYTGPFVNDPASGRGARSCSCGARDCERCLLTRVAAVLDRPVVERLASTDAGNRVDAQRIMVRDFMTAMTERAMAIGSMIETAVQVEDMFLFDDDAELMQHVLSQINEVADIGEQRFVGAAPAHAPDLDNNNSSSSCC